MDQVKPCFPEGFPRQLLEPSPPVSPLMATLSPEQVDCILQVLGIGAVSDFAFGFRQPTGEEIDQFRHCFPAGIPIELKEAGQQSAGMALGPLDCVRNAIGQGAITEFSLEYEGPMAGNSRQSSIASPVIRSGRWKRRWSA